MDYYTASMMSSMVGGLGLISILTAAAYIIPVVALGFVFYYFTGAKKYGEGLMHNLMRVGLRTYNFIWMFIASITAFGGLYQVFSYIFEKILPEVKSSSSSLYEDYDSLISPSTTDTPAEKVLVIGLSFLVIALILFAIHFAFNYFVQNKLERKGTVVTKLFAISGIVSFSVIFFGSLIGVVQGLVDYAYDKDLGLASGNFAALFASFFIWIGFAVYGYFVFIKESGQKIL